MRTAAAAAITRTGAQQPPADPHDSGRARCGPSPPLPKASEFLIVEFKRLFVEPEREDPAYVNRILDHDVPSLFLGSRRPNHRVARNRRILDTIVARGCQGHGEPHCDHIPEKRDVLDKWAHFLIDLEKQARCSRIAAVKASLPPPRGRALSDLELRAYVVHARQATRYRPLEHLARILLFTAVESNELARAQWADIDVERLLWRVPPGKLEDREIHLVPLTASAAADFKALKALTGHSDYVLPHSNRNEPVKPGYFAHRLARYQGRFQQIGVSPFVASDLQVSCRNTLLGLGIPTTDVDRLFIRIPADLDPDYNAYEGLKEKRRALEQWEAFLLSLAKSREGRAAVRMLQTAYQPAS